MAEQRGDGAAEALAQLYGVPLDAFMARRKELAALLRAAGDAAGAKAVAAAAKPTRTAWALGQVARQRPELVKALVDARDAAAGVQGGGQADALRATQKAYRDRVAEVLAAAKAVLDEAGLEANAIQVRRMGETLQTASARGSEHRDALVAGTLAKDVGLDDPFGGLGDDAADEATEAPARPAPAQRAKAEAPARPGEAGARPGEAAARSRAAQEKARATEEQAREAERAQERARREAAAQAARAKVAELEEALGQARADARAAEVAAVRAQAEAERARRAAVDTETRLQRARDDLRAALA